MARDTAIKLGATIVPAASTSCVLETHNYIYITPAYIISAPMIFLMRPAAYARKPQLGDFTLTVLFSPSPSIPHYSSHEQIQKLGKDLQIEWKV